MTKEERLLITVFDNLEIDIFTKDSLKTEHNIDLLDWRNPFKNLVNKGYFINIEKGKYCRHNFRDEYVISNYLVSDAVVAYWSALSLHGFTEQFPNVVFVQTNKQKKHKTVFGVRYQFIKVKPEKMIGIKKEGYGNHQYRLTDIEKTIVDCFDLPQYSGGFAELLRAFAEAELHADKMIHYCQAVQNISATKRMAFLVELLQKSSLKTFLDYAQSIVNKKYTLFDAFGKDEGEFIKKWKLRMNLSQEQVLDIINTPY